jgi:hypothetical protein
MIDFLGCLIFEDVGFLMLDVGLDSGTPIVLGY